MSYFELTVFNRIAAQQKETNDLLRELIKQLKDQKTYLPKFGEVRPSPPPVFYPDPGSKPGYTFWPASVPYTVGSNLNVADTVSIVPCETVQVDPCPNCPTGQVCRTFACGRLRAKNEKRS